MKKLYFNRACEIYKDNYRKCYFIRLRIVVEIVRNSIEATRIINSLCSTGMTKKNRLVTLLHSKGFLTSQKPEIERNKSYFMSLDLKSKFEFTMPILIFGSGGGGGTLTYLLAQFGFKNLTVCDFDIVNESDVLKTVVYDKNNIGEKKIDALARKIYRNFKIKIATLDYKYSPSKRKALEEIIEKVDPALIVKAIDPGFQFTYLLNKISTMQKIPTIYMAYGFEKIALGPFIIPGKTSCYKSLLSHNMIDNIKSKNLAKYNPYNYFVHPSIPFNINILANFILQDIAMFFSSNFNFVKTTNRILEFDLLNFEVNEIVLRCKSSCVCQNSSVSELEV